MPAPTGQLKLDDKTYTIKVSLGTLKKFEELTGKNALAQDTFDSMSAGLLSSLVYAMIVEEVEQDDVDDMLHPGNMEYVSEQISSLIGEFDSKKKATSKKSGQ